MPSQDFKGNVRPPFEMPSHLRERQKGKTYEEKVPLLIQIFTWYCVARCLIFLTFALIIGILPQSAATPWVIRNFDRFPPSVAPEGVFYIFAGLYGLIAFRWFRRDWKARWGTMFLTGAGAAQNLVSLIAEHAAGNPDNLPAGTEAMVIAGSLLNLMICAYLAFYPGMEQAFPETD